MVFDDDKPKIFLGMDPYPLFSSGPPIRIFKTDPLACKNLCPAMVLTMFIDKEARTCDTPEMKANNNVGDKITKHGERFSSEETLTDIFNIENINEFDDENKNAVKQMGQAFEKKEVLPRVQDVHETVVTKEELFLLADENAEEMLQISRETGVIDNMVEKVSISKKEALMEAEDASQGNFDVFIDAEEQTDEGYEASNDRDTDVESSGEICPSCDVNVEIAQQEKQSIDQLAMADEMEEVIERKTWQGADETTISTTDDENHENGTLHEKSTLAESMIEEEEHTVIAKDNEDDLMEAEHVSQGICDVNVDSDGHTKEVNVASKDEDTDKETSVKICLGSANVDIVQQEKQRVYQSSSADEMEEVIDSKMCKATDDTTFSTTNDEDHDNVTLHEKDTLIGSMTEEKENIVIVTDNKDDLMETELGCQNNCNVSIDSDKHTEEVPVVSKSEDNNMETLEEICLTSDVNVEIPHQENQGVDQLSLANKTEEVIDSKTCQAADETTIFTTDDDHDNSILIGKDTLTEAILEERENIVIATDNKENLVEIEQVSQDNFNVSIDSDEHNEGVPVVSKNENIDMETSVEICLASDVNVEIPQQEKQTFDQLSSADDKAEIIDNKTYQTADEITISATNDEIQDNVTLHEKDALIESMIEENESIVIGTDNKDSLMETEQVCQDNCTVSIDSDEHINIPEVSKMEDTDLETSVEICLASDVNIEIPQPEKQNVHQLSSADELEEVIDSQTCKEADKTTNRMVDDQDYDNVMLHREDAFTEPVTEENENLVTATDMDGLMKAEHGFQGNYDVSNDSYEHTEAMPSKDVGTDMDTSAEICLSSDVNVEIPQQEKQTVDQMSTADDTEEVMIEENENIVIA